MGRPEPDVVVRRGKPVILGGVEKSLPPLVISRNRAWKELIGEKFAELFGGLKGQNDWTAILGTVAGLTDVQVELICAYDEGGHLGGAEWIEANATEEEVYEAFKVVLGLAFPSIRDLTRFPALLGQLLAQIPTQAPSTSSGSPSGDSGQSGSNTS